MGAKKHSPGGKDLKNLGLAAAELDVGPGSSMGSTGKEPAHVPGRQSGSER